mgnify:CR=1 FL=1
MMFDKEKRRKALYKEVFTSEAGEEVLHDIMRHNYVFNTTQSSDPLEMSFNEGRRAVILAIMHNMQKSPSQLMEEQAEIYGRISTDNREQSLDLN